MNPRSWMLSEKKKHHWNIDSPAFNISSYLCHVWSTYQTVPNVNIASPPFSAGWQACSGNTAHYHKSNCVLSHLFKLCNIKKGYTVTQVASDYTSPVRPNQMDVVWSGCQCNLSPPKHMCHYCLPHRDPSETLRLWKYRWRGGVRRHHFEPWPGTNSAH